MVRINRKVEQGVRTREALLSECLALFSRRGFVGTSIDDVARAAGVTKGAIYWHFESKDDLFQAIVARIRTRWHGTVLGHVTQAQAPRERIAALFDGYAELFTESPEICLFLQRVLLDDSSSGFSAQVGEVFNKTARFIARILDDGKRAGQVHRDVDSTIVAHLVLAALTGASQQVIANRSLNIKRVIAEAKAMTLARIAPTERTSRHRAGSAAVRGRSRSS